MQPHNNKVVWEPIPGSSQEFALDSRANVTLYTGTRGPGKTDVQLMRFRSRVGIGYGAFWRGVIFDKEYKNLDDLVAKTKRWFPAFEDGARFLSSAKDYKWVWPTGEELLFRSIKTMDDYWDYHGQEFPFVGWNELTKYPTSQLFDAIFSCNRSSFTPEKDNPSLPPIPLEVFATTNPHGPGHNWVKKRFINPAPYGRVIEDRTRVFNPRTQKEEDIIRKQVAIFGNYKENIYLSPEYIAGMDAILDENLKKAWLLGSWDLTAGGVVDDLWDSNIHVIERFQIPASWKLDRSFDWGSSHPFSVGWWAESNGEDVIMPSGRIFMPPKGTLIRINEWYGSRVTGTNKGLAYGPTQIANGIRKIEASMLDDGWIKSIPSPGPADNQIGNVVTTENDSIKIVMQKLGVSWTESDKSSGSRKIGLQLLRERLKRSILGEGPGIYFFRNCSACIELLPILSPDESGDDVDTDCEDHIYDEIRYRVLRGNNRIAQSIPVVYAWN